MNEILREQSSVFKRPDNLKGEEGEIKRVAAHFDENLDSFVMRFIQAYADAPMVRLTPRLLAQLENSDVQQVEEGNWAHVQELADMVKRDWEDIREKIDNNVPIDAPIVVRYRDTLHLVSGNTRLMVAKAAGKPLDVALVSLKDY